MIKAVYISFCIIFLHFSALSQESLTRFEAPNVLGKTAKNDRQSQLIPRAYSQTFRELSESIKEFELYEFDYQGLHEFLQTSTNKVHFRLMLGESYDWEIVLVPNDLRSEDYIVREIGLNSRSQRPLDNRVTTFKGRLLSPGGGEVRLTVNEYFMKGFVTFNGKKIFLEDLGSLGIPQQNQHLITYAEGALEDDGELLCAAQELENIQRDLPDDSLQMGELCVGWRPIYIATAASYNLYEEFDKNISAVNDHILSLYNMIQPSFDVFNARFNIVEQVVFTNPSSPQLSERDIDDLIYEFSNWGLDGFVKKHTLGALFFKGKRSGTVGKAFVGSMCSGRRYSVNDYLKGADKNRVLLAHETGHNFGSGHDKGGAPFLMAPRVSKATSFSPESQEVINRGLNRRLCPPCFNGENNLPPVTKHQVFGLNVGQLFLKIRMQETYQLAGKPNNAISIIYGRIDVRP